MRTLGKGEAPVKGSVVTVTFKGKVSKVSGGLFTVTNELGHEMFFEHGGDRTGVEIREVTPAPPKWETGSMYCHPTGYRSYYLRVDGGWKAVTTGEVFFDGSMYIDDSFLKELKIMEVKE